MPPDYLYKYTPLRDAADAKRNERFANLLTDSALWFTAPVDFNDPMDCRPVFRFEGGTPEERDEFRHTVFRSLVSRNFPSLRGKELKARYRAYEKQYPSLTEEVCAIGHKALAADIRDRLVGVLCLSECERDPVMYYHYADKHKGMCLKFKALDFFQHAELVEYSSTYPVVDYFDSSNNEQQFRKIFLTKYEGWRYEHEYRVVNFHQNPKERSAKYPRILLEGVIFGYLMPNADRDYAKGLLEQRGSLVTLYEAKVSSERYLMDIVPLEQIGSR
ncbi:DUF2971 domain-containing protein [Paraburkholderia caribensis]|uniref:DUF2971 domain-containing protein n=1 Tax=Paraburkholderia caribensis TaxID=75105 RepID=UPI000A40F43F|nr:DUF2971 domain-containing protein [Paraburkholderia caribensis]